MSARLGLVLAAALALRLALVALPGFVPDHAAFVSWAQALAASGPQAAYGPGIAPAIDYPPGYLYVLWALGAGHAATGGGDLAWRLLLKSVPIAADLALVVVLYAVVRRVASADRAVAIAWLAALFPPLWLDSAVWGQVDSVPTALLCAAIWAALAGSVVVVWLLLAGSLLVKPQALVALPPLAAAVMARGRRAVLGCVVGIVAASALAYLATVPFAPGRDPGSVFAFLIDRYVAGAAKAPHTTEGAFNLFALVSPLYASDAAGIGPVSFRTLGIALVALTVCATTYRLWRTLRNDPDRARRTALTLAGASLCSLALFLFATRMHERYLLAGVTLGLPLVFDDRATALAYGWLTATFVLNVAFVLAGFSGGAHHPTTVVIARVCAGGNLLAFGVLWTRTLAHPADFTRTWWRQGDSNS